jgi:glucoamylase
LLFCIVLSNGWFAAVLSQATALMMFADSLIANGEMDYVKQYLWTGDSNKYMGGAIKRDLDYIVSGFGSSTCDLWEEIRSTNLFWNRLSMKKAMGMGADFAATMGDSSTSGTYENTEQKINSTLYSDHWTGSYVIEDVSRTKVYQ